MLQFLNTHSLTALGWSLLNGIWQMGILWLVYLLLTGNHKRFSAAVRHNLAGILSGLGFSWFLYSLISSLIYPAGFIEWTPAFNLTAYISAAISPFLSALSTVYLAILVFQTIRYVLGFYQLQFRKKRSGQLFCEPLQLFSDRISPAMGIRKKVNILLVNWADTAQTIGFIKPLVLLPVALVNRLTPEQVETILLHELEHIRRNDYFINILMTIFRTLFFFNPFAHFFFKTVAREREHACDDGVLLWDYPAPVYAEALFTLEKFRQLPHTLSLAADGNNPRLLMERIRRVIGLPIPGRSPFSPLFSFSLVAALFIFTVNSFSHFSGPGDDLRLRNRVTAQNNIAYLISLDQTSGSAGLQEIHIVIKRKPAAIKSEPEIRQISADPVLPEEMKKPASVTDPPGLREEMEGEGVNEQLQYADHNEVRNYSNEQAAQPELPVVVDLAGAPYIPPASFSFSPAGDTLIADVLLQNKLKALLAIGKIKTDELQSKLNLKLKDLRLMEKENRMLIEQKQKELQPLLKKIRLNIQYKKEEISHLQVQLQIQRGEVIVI